MPTVIDLTVPVIDLTSADDPPKIVNCDAGDHCPICWETMKDASVYFVPPCGHVHCRRCMEDNRLYQCGRCSQPYIVAEQVLVNIPGSTYDLTNTD